MMEILLCEKLQAVFYEVLRYRTPGPLGIVHRAERDTTLMGFSIPKVSYLKYAC